MSDDLCLRAAQSIGQSLCATAQWQGNLCHWPEDSDLVASQSLSREGCLYSGSAGIGLFLAELFAVCPQMPFATTAKAALRHAADLASRSDDMSLFEGVAGVVHALRRGARNLEDAELWQHHRELLDRLLLSHEMPRLDLFFGAAGCITLLLSYPEDERCLSMARTLGRDLCDNADWQDDFCNWDAMIASGFTSPPLGGLSHGVAGIAAALLALYARTGDPEMLTTARAAFAYDELLHDRQSNCWLDLRFVESLEQAKASGSTMTAWCHGAPGIALARSAAAQLDRACTADHLRVLERAATATMAGLGRAAAAAQGCDMTLCHGAFGLIDVLNSVHAQLPEFHCRRAARAAATRFAEFAMAGEAWLSDHAQLAGPSLMRGTAGVGYALLRLSRPGTLPSVLLLLREEETIRASG